MFDISSVKLTATPGSSGWAQVHDFLPESNEAQKLRGHLFVVIATKNVNDGIENVESGRRLLSKLHEQYFGDLTEKPFNALKNSTQSIYDEFKNIWGETEIVVCAIVDNVVYSSAAGGASVSILRDGGLATILASNGDDVACASGYPKVGDTIVLSTKVFSQTVSGTELKQALESGNLDSARDIIAPLVHSSSQSGSIGAILINFSEKTNINVFAPKELPAFIEPKSFDVNKKVSEFFSNISKKFPQRQIYIRPSIGDEVASQGKKVTFSVAIILLLLLIISIGFGVRQKRANEIKSKYQGILTEALQNVDDAISLASVSPDKSRELFVASEEKLKTIESLKVKDPKILELKQKIESSRASVLGEYAVSLSPFLDLSLLSSGFKGDEVSASAGNIFILDKGGKKIVSVNISTKKSKVVAGPGVIDQVNNLASYEDKAFILTNDGIYDVGSNGKNKVVEKTWDGDALIKLFAGNIYVLDKSANAIYRYSGGGGASFGSRQNWLAGGSSGDFSNAKQWVIDGSVYVLNPNSKVLKYSLGSPQGFKITGTVPEIGTVDAIYASDETQFVYFLDKAGKRVVVTDKKGAYKAQYINDGIGNATNLVVSEKDKKIILLTGDKLTSIEIKHI